MEYKTFADIQERITEIAKRCNELGYSNTTLELCTNSTFTENKLHAIVHALRERLPEEWVVLIAQSALDYFTTLVAVRAYYHDDVPNEILQACINANNLDAVGDIMDKIRHQEDVFDETLRANQLFRSKEVTQLLKDNDVVYIRHEFNWNTYHSKLVLEGATGKLYFPMPEIPLIGGCWSNFVAERMLHGQLYLQCTFRTAAASLRFYAEDNQCNCKIIACDNCFYAPYLYFVREKATGALETYHDVPTEKVYMDYLINEHPKAYEWLMNHPDGKHFYDDFYVKATPEL